MGYNNIQVSLKTFVELIGGVVILWAGGVSVINGDMTIGALITFNSLLAYFLDPVKSGGSAAADADCSRSGRQTGKYLILKLKSRKMNKENGTRKSCLEDIKFEHEFQIRNKAKGT